jgi:antitoxin ParD1/3/4
MSKMKTSPPDRLRPFAVEQTSHPCIGTGSDHMHGLTKDHDRQRLRALLVDGANSRSSGSADLAYFAALRNRVERKIQT